MFKNIFNISKKKEEVMNMYFGREDILLHATDDTYEFCKEAFKSQNPELVYATGLMFCSPFWNKEKCITDDTYTKDWNEKWLLQLLPKEKNTENMDIINSVLHQVHEEGKANGKNIRADAIILCNHIFQYHDVMDKNKTYAALCLNLDDMGIQSTNENGILKYNEEINAEIQEKLSMFDDISICAGAEFAGDRGNPFYEHHTDAVYTQILDYKENKSANAYRVAICSTSEESLKMCLEQLEKYRIDLEQTRIKLEKQDKEIRNSQQMQHEKPSSVEELLKGLAEKCKNIKTQTNPIQVKLYIQRRKKDDDART